jgi:plastocyanin
MTTAMRFLIACALFVGAALPLAACGSGDDGDGDTTAAAAGEIIEVSATDFSFDPPTIQLDQAGEYTFRLTNDGGTAHALEIEGAGIEEATTDTIGPGETAELTVELKEGEYEMYCPVDGHRSEGMEGTIMVSGAAGGGTTTSPEGETTTNSAPGY